MWFVFPFSMCAVCAVAGLSLPRFASEALSEGLRTADGANVQVFRYLGGRVSHDAKWPVLANAWYADGSGGLANARVRPQLNPFLVLDAYRADDPSDFSGGFPAHPHRGMLEIRHFHRGGLRHEDSCGTTASTASSGAQALFAGRGIAHEEMPLPPLHPQCTGFYGFQLWINVPSDIKSQTPQYMHTDALPLAHLARDGVGLRLSTSSEAILSSKTLVSVLAGGEERAGPFTALPGADSLHYYDIRLFCPDGILRIPTPPKQNAIVYVFSPPPACPGEETLPAARVIIGPRDSPDAVTVAPNTLVILGDGDHLHIQCEQLSDDSVARILFSTARPVNEPVFVAEGFAMASRRALDEAMQDLAEGRSTRC